jgi:hypothetical protein
MKVLTTNELIERIAELERENAILRKQAGRIDEIIKEWADKLKNMAT